MGFASMLAALLSLCNMFAGKCEENILIGAGANFHILTHKEGPPKPPPAPTAPDPEQSAPSAGTQNFFSPVGAFVSPQTASTLVAQSRPEATSLYQPMQMQ